MVYSSDAAKWRAYQFLDPFAAGSFYVCNKINKYFCRPDCDAHPMTELRLEIKFVPTVPDAVDLGYVPCESCDPILVPPVDVDMMIMTVRDINASIGFVPPLMDDEDEKVNLAIKENIMENQPQRRQLVPAISYNGKYSGFNRESQTAVSKNDNEHYKLVDLACRHLALAAALSVFAVPSASNSPKLEESTPDPFPGKKSRKRRGGVLGFKELAAKSKLSAWHFHRVFKSVTGLTPKTYGDKCYEYLQNRRDEAKDVRSSSASSAQSSDSGRSFLSIENLNKAYSSPALSVGSLILPITGHKRLRNDDVDYPSPKRAMKPVSTPTVTPFTDFTSFDEESAPGFDFESRATSAPDLTAFNLRPQSLFAHNKPVDFVADMPYNSVDAMPLQMFPLLEIVPMVNLQTLMDPTVFPEEPLNTFGGAGFSADMFATTGEDLLQIQPELDIADSLSFGLLPELLTSNVGL